MTLSPGKLQGLLALGAERHSEGWKNEPWLGAAPLLILVAFTFMVFKASFVRHDAHGE